MLSLRRAIASVCAAGVISFIVDDDQRVDDCGQSFTAGIWYVPYNTCSSSHDQHTGSACLLSTRPLSGNVGWRLGVGTCTPCALPAAYPVGNAGGYLGFKSVWLRNRQT